jgi:hypothetical protein
LPPMTFAELSGGLQRAWRPRVSAAAGSSAAGPKPGRTSFNVKLGGPGGFGSVFGYRRGRNELLDVSRHLVGLTLTTDEDRTEREVT